MPKDSVQSKAAKRALKPTEQVVGDSGRRFFIEKVLQEKEGYPFRVYLATSVYRNDHLQYLYSITHLYYQIWKPKVRHQGHR